MFIYCLNKELKEELLKNNFRLLYSKENLWVFEMNVNNKFNFSSKSEGKDYYFSKKLFFKE